MKSGAPRLHECGRVSAALAELAEEELETRSGGTGPRSARRRRCRPSPPRGRQPPRRLRDCRARSRSSQCAVWFVADEDADAELGVTTTAMWPARCPNCATTKDDRCQACAPANGQPLRQPANLRGGVFGCQVALMVLSFVDALTIRVCWQRPAAARSAPPAQREIDAT